MKKILVLIICSCFVLAAHAQGTNSKTTESKKVKPASANPSALRGDENNNPDKTGKTGTEILTYKPPQTPGGAEGVKTLSGNTKKPTQEVSSPSTLDHSKVPAPAEQKRTANTAGSRQ